MGQNQRHRLGVLLVALPSLLPACGDDTSSTSDGGSGAATTTQGASGSTTASGTSSTSSAPSATGSQGGGSPASSGNGGDGGDGIGAGGQGGGDGGGGSGPTTSGDGGSGGAGAGGAGNTSGGGADGGGGAGGASGSGGNGGSGSGGTGAAGSGGAGGSADGGGGAGCADGFDDCDGDAGNGCETPIDTLIDCGGCDLPCAPDNATGSCDAGVCAVAGCDGGFDDCDDDATNGCEGDLASELHCGVCGNACEAGWACEGAECTRIPAVDVAVGFGVACVVLEDGAAHCWGDNRGGRLGNGTTASSSTPVPVVGVSDATRIAAGFSSLCVLRSSGAVACWGSNDTGALGNGTLTPSTLPVAVSGLTDATEVSIGIGHACALREGGSVVCWGSNGSGQLGNGTIVPSTTPVAVAGITDAVSVTAGGNFSCALRQGGAVSCWGFGPTIGRNSTIDSPTPVAVTGLTDATQLSSSVTHSCAVRQNGNVMCWGNVYGNTRLTPVALDVNGDVTRVSVGNGRSCFLRTSGQVFCGGDNGQGQRATGFADNNTAPLAPALGWGATSVTDVTRVAITDGMCVLRGDAEVWCAGNGDMLGDGQLYGSNGIMDGAERWYLYPVRGRAPRLFEDGSCTGGLDEDGDGAIDCADADCATDAGSALGNNAIVSAIDGRMATNYRRACGASTRAERRHLWRAPAAGTYRFVSTATAYETILTIEESGCGAILACQDDSVTPGVGATVTVPLAAGQEIGVVVDAVSSGDGEYRVAITQQ